MIILFISGTPGTGKTSVSEAIAKKINARVISLNSIAHSEGLTSDYDEERDTWVINEKEIIKKAFALIKKAENEGIEVLILESHFVDIIPKRIADYIIVLRCEPEILTQRLSKRGYNYKKVVENVQSEILGNCLNYFIEKEVKTPIFEINTSEISIDQLRDEIIKIIYKKEDGGAYIVGKIDWLEKLFESDELMKYFD